MRVGHWQRCLANIAHKKVNVSFFKKPNYPHDYCELCVYEIRKQNGSLVTGHRSTMPRHSNEAKPEKDTL